MFDGLKLRSKVRRGRKLLNKELGKGWEKKIDLSNLDLNSSTKCILGQVYGFYTDGTISIGITDKKAERYGFYIDGALYPEEYRPLTAEWKRQLAKV